MSLKKVLLKNMQKRQYTTMTTLQLHAKNHAKIKQYKNKHMKIIIMLMKMEKLKESKISSYILAKKDMSIL